MPFGGGGGGNTTTVQKADPWVGQQPFLIGQAGKDPVLDEFGNVVEPGQSAIKGLYPEAGRIYDEALAQGAFPGSTFVEPNAYGFGAVSHLVNTSGALANQGLNLKQLGDWAFQTGAAGPQFGEDAAKTAASLMPGYRPGEFSVEDYSGPSAAYTANEYSGPTGDFTAAGYSGASANAPIASYSGPSAAFSASAYDGPDPSYAPRGYSGPEAAYNASAYQGAGAQGQYQDRAYTGATYAGDAFTDWTLDPTQNPNFMPALEASYNPIMDRYMREILPAISSQAESLGAYGGSGEAFARAQSTNDLTRNLSDATAKAVLDAYKFERSGLAEQENQEAARNTQRWIAGEQFGTSRYNTVEQLRQEMAKQAEALATQRWATGEELGTRASIANAANATQRYTTEEQLLQDTNKAAAMLASQRWTTENQLAQDAKKADAALATQRYGVTTDAAARQAIAEAGLDTQRWSTAQTLEQRAAEAAAQMASQRWGTAEQLAATTGAQEAALASQRWGTGEQLDAQRANVLEQLANQRWGLQADAGTKLALQREDIAGDTSKLLLGMAPQMGALSNQAYGASTAMGNQAAQITQGWDAARKQSEIADYYAPIAYQNEALKNYMGPIMGFNPGGTVTSSAPGPSSASAALGGALGGGMLGYSAGPAVASWITGAEAGSSAGIYGAAIGAILGALAGSID